MAQNTTQSADGWTPVGQPTNSAPQNQSPSQSADGWTPVSQDVNQGQQQPQTSFMDKAKGVIGDISNPVNLLEGVGSGVLNSASDLLKTARGAMQGQGVANLVPGVAEGEALLKKLMSAEEYDKFTQGRSQAAHTVVPDVVTNWLDKNANIEHPNAGTAVGYGGENLLEFIMGDEALKGLSIADKTMQAAKVMKLLEKSPKLMNALKAGSLMGKSADVIASLAPEERALIKQYPVLGRLAKAGMEAIRQGTVEGIQTTAKTNDPEKGLASGGIMAGISAPLGVVGAVRGGLAAKAADTGKAIEDMVSRGADAKGAQTIAGETQQAIGDAKQTAYDTALGEAAKAPEKSTISGNITNAVNEEKSKAYAPVFDDAKDAPLKSETAEAVRQNIKEASNKLHEDFEAGQQDIVNKVGDKTIDVAGSPLSKTAQGILDDISSTSKSTHESVKKAAKITEKNVDPDLVDLLKDWSTGVKKSASSTGGAGFTGSTGAKGAEKAIQPFNVNDLIELRKKVRLIAEKGDYGDLTSRYARKMMYSIDDTIGELGGGSIKEQYGKMKDAYREGIEKVNSNLIKGIANESTGKAVTDISGNLLSGKNAKDKIDGLVSTIGRQNVDKAADSIWKNAVNDAEGDPNKVLKWWDKIDDEAKQSLFGSRYQDLTNKMEEMRLNAGNFKDVESVKDAESMMSNTNSVKQFRRLVGDSKADEIAKDTFANWQQEAKGDPSQFIKKWNSVPEESKKSFFGDLYHNYSFIASDAEKQVARFKGLDNIDNVVSKLQGEGKGALDFAKDAKDVLGKEKTDALAQDVSNYWVKQATRNGVFDPKTFLDEYGKVSDEVKHEFFSGGNAESLHGLLDNAQSIQKMQRLAKIGFNVGGGLAGAAAGAIGADAVGRKFGIAGSALPALLGVLAGGTGGYAAGNRLLDYLVQHPESWNKVSKAVAVSPKTSAVVKATELPAKKAATEEIMKHVYSGANPMAGNQ